MMTDDEFERLWRRLQLFVGRGRVSFVNDAGPVQLVQVRLNAAEMADATPRLAEYGFQSNPPTGSDGVLLFLSGDRSNGVVIATGSQTYRMRGLASGEVAISDDKGQSVYLSAAGIRIDGGGLPISISNTPHLTATADTITLNGDTTINGTTVLNGPIVQEAGGSGTGASLIGPLTVSGDVTAQGTSVHAHTHGGVQPGSGTSGSPT